VDESDFDDGVWFEVEVEGFFKSSSDVVECGVVFGGPVLHISLAVGEFDDAFEDVYLQLDDFVPVASFDFVFAAGFGDVFECGLDGLVFFACEFV
jgi:hypothetical protein